jgi:transcriptional regulator with XRE-family HTH domain
MSQAQLADMLGVDQSYVSQIERGRRLVRNVEFLIHVSEVLGIPRAQLGLANTRTRRRHPARNLPTGPHPAKHPRLSC